MKREYNINDKDYLAYLKSIGCVYWFPFSEAGDFTDRISGNELVRVYGYPNAFQWDSTENAMLVTSPSTRTTQVAYFDYNTTFADNAYTVVQSFKRKSTSGYPMICYMGAVDVYYGNTALVLVSSTLATGDISRWQNRWYDTAIRIDPIAGQRTMFEDGVQRLQDGNYNYLPTSWPSQRLLFMTDSYNLRQNRQVYWSDIMLFNKALSLEEVRKVQGYDRI